MLQFSTPLSAAFIPLVPHASSGRRGLFSHTSQPWQHRAGDRHVVVLQEHEAVADVELAGEELDLADHVLARLVGGMGLAGEDELHRAVGVEQQPAQALGLRQQQRRPLVRGEAAGEADGQRVADRARLAET